MSINMKTFESLGLTEKKPATEAAKSNQMGQDTFLKLLMTQLEKQNPLNPQDSSEFVTQLAQFSMVSGIQSLQDNLATVVSSMGESQALQAANLVGKRAMIASDKAVLGATGNVSGALDLTSNASDVKVRVVNSAGATVRTMEMGDKKAGSVSFTWDGLLDDGVTRADPGTYKLKAEAVIDGATTALTPHVLGKVESVSLGGPQGVDVDLGVLGRHKLADILEVAN